MTGWTGWTGGNENANGLSRAQLQSLELTQPAYSNDMGSPEQNLSDQSRAALWKGGKSEPLRPREFEQLDFLSIQSILFSCQFLISNQSPRSAGRIVIANPEPC